MQLFDWKGFLRRRFSAEEYLGLHLTVGLLLSLALLGLFAGVGHFAIGHGRVVRFDEELGLSLAEHRGAHPWVRDFFLALTQLGSVPVMVTLVVGLTLFLLVRRQRLLALAWLFAVAGGGLI